MTPSEVKAWMAGFKTGLDMQDGDDEWFSVVQGIIEGMDDGKTPAPSLKGAPMPNTLGKPWKTIGSTGLMGDYPGVVGALQSAGRLTRNEVYIPPSNFNQRASDVQINPHTAAIMAWAGGHELPEGYHKAEDGSLHGPNGWQSGRKQAERTED